MSPLNTNPTVLEGDAASNEVVNIDANPPKISYAMDELLRLRDAAKQPAKMQETPQLRMVARINLMPTFAASCMPSRTPTVPSSMPLSMTSTSSSRSSSSSSSSDGRNSFQGRRHHMHHQQSNGGGSGGHDYNGYSNKSSREMTINQSKQRFLMSLSRDVKLREAENAWKPSVMKNNDPKHGSEVDEMGELLRAVRCILNKLTATNFDVMLDQFKELTVDTKDKLNEVITMIFDKAVNEPNFSTGYALLCKHLSKCSEGDESQRAFFKRRLITKCQLEFEQNVANAQSIDKALQPLKQKLKECPLSDLAQINAIKANIIEEESNIRRRLVSTVRFIGELYKLDMLTTNIMNWCIKCLVDSGAEDKLECLCKLLTTIGQKLETKPTADSSERDRKQYLDLSEYFKQLRKIADRKMPKVKVSSRIRFMIMDLIDLRTNNWKPKKTNLNGVELK